MADDDISELVDEDVLPEEYPPERPYGVDQDADAVDSVAERARRERPDHLGADEGRVGQLVAPGGEGSGDDEATEVAEEIAPRQRRDQRDPSDLSGVEGTDREEVLSAEEAAMHLTDEPPLGDGDGYVDE